MKAYDEAVNRLGSPETPFAPRAGANRPVTLEISSTARDRLDSVNAARALSTRTAALIELGLELQKQHEPSRLLETFCRGAQDVMGGRIAAVCMIDEQGPLSRFAAQGPTADQIIRIQHDLEASTDLLGRLLGSDLPRRVNRAGGDLAALGLPESHPKIDNFLAVPIACAHYTRGVFYVADRPGRHFDEEDQQLAEMLAASLASQYENLVLYDVITRYDMLLELEANERQDAVRQLCDSELKFRQLVEHVHQVFILIDVVRNRLLYVSPAFEAVWKRSRESLYALPWSWLDAVHPNGNAEVVERFRSAPADTLVHFDLEYRIGQPDDSVRWIRSRGFPIYDHSGRIYRLAGIAEDITRRRMCG